MESAFRTIVDAPGFSVVEVDGQVEFSFDSIQHNRDVVIATIKMMGYAIKSSRLVDETWEYGELTERGMHGKGNATGCITPIRRRGGRR